MNEHTTSDTTGQRSPLADILDELADRLAVGDPVDLAPYLARFPEQSDQLQEVFGSLRQLFSLRGELPDDVWAPGALTTPLGDFRLLREIGRGGMGVVYEAEQLSLCRRMAVKILPFAALLNRKQLERFRNEARAAAMLKHPNIVSVHSVGCERGVHYYAMDLVVGGSFAELICHLRQEASAGHGTVPPTSEQCVEHGPQIGHTGISDGPHAGQTETFPLAQLTTEYLRSPRQYYREVARLGAILADAIQFAHEQGVTHRDLKPSNLLLDDQGIPWITDFGLAHVQGSPALTMTGDRLGTLRYMSPEQANGQKLLDHRTDIYSLGATLYELLTLRPAFDSEDRAQLLRQVADEQPPPMRFYSRLVPRDLETIIMKSMAKRADDRYESAAIFADDLRRCLEQKPIHARRAGWLHRSLRWAQRHRLAAALLSITLLLLITLSVAGPLAARRYALLAASEAKSRQAAQVVRAELHLLLRDTLATTTKTLEDTPGIDPLHRRLAYDTLAHYERLLELYFDSPRIRREVAKGYITFARVIDLRFDKSSAGETVRHSIDMLETLTRENPQDTELLADLADAYLLQGANGWMSEPIGKAVAICEELVRRFPREPRYRLLLGWSQQYYGATLANEHNFFEAERQIRSSHNTFRELTESDSVNGDYRAGLANARRFLANVYVRTGRLLQADEESRESLALASANESYILSSTRYRLGYANVISDRADVLYHMRRLGEAEKLLYRAVQLLKESVDGFPDSDWARTGYCETQTKLGDCLVALGRSSDAETAYRDAVTGWDHPNLGAVRK